MTQNINNFNEQITKFYSNAKSNIINKIDISKDYEFVFLEENNMNIVEFYLNKKLKLRAEYNILGLYNMPLSIWYWSWNIAFINKNLIVNSLKDFVNVLDKNYSKFDPKEAEELYYLFSNDNFYISAKNIDKLIKVSLFLTQGLWIFPILHKNSNKMDKVEYLLIKKIIQF